MLIRRLTTWLGVAAFGAYMAFAADWQAIAAYWLVGLLVLLALPALLVLKVLR